ncbi:Bardet-Biedl syndrome 7 protein like [Dissostichus eleginoides]|uniref:Bardet-Biedl syndrome 7 protein like n=1 Tax=Dissostichus eleginoides TaxID=100907 RepID=A0AAD9BPD4_DISEL|nr:Bardet-Biedl syndrome 7 protein like [Dissostichus eleginoides]
MQYIPNDREYHQVLCGGSGADSSAPCLSLDEEEKTVSSTSEANEPIETVELESGPDYINVSDLNMVSAEQTEEPEEQEDLV